MDSHHTAMAITIHLDLMLVLRKRTSRELAHFVGITEQNLSLLKSGKVRGVRFATLSRICEYLECQPGDILHFTPEEEDKRELP
jgi:putative transcriptional regulator